ncbi:rRNA maturation protein [Archaeoglobus veneficus]|uniref:Probable Brix domain-containing ribosomal biogenesis protein n=1 Tax=Archaeoglobus veneficus (strain DSM 11195 / SNP6) TaxID=693661 RepID=F2KSN8_ARCVS|nr:rRNA maturation protein [Archaeoglobus veneficus]AEA48108.1 Brix domain protein [Archaeoglobus veneficus SNP6]
MILTTSRKPGRKTRRLAKVLARFMGWRYVQRGKLSLDELSEFSDFAIVQEIKGNPAILRVFRRGREVLYLRFNAGEVEKVKMEPGPVVFVGKPPFDPLVLGAIPHTKAGMKFAQKIDARKKVYVRRTGKTIVLDFTYGEKTIMRLKCYESGIQFRN